MYMDSIMIMIMGTHLFYVERQVQVPLAQLGAQEMCERLLEEPIQRVDRREGVLSRPPRAYTFRRGEGEKLEERVITSNHHLV